MHGHAAGRDERLSLRIESLAVIATRNRVLTLGVVGVDVGWKLPIGVGDPGSCRVRPRRVGGVGGEAWLRPSWLHEGWNGT